MSEKRNYLLKSAAKKNVKGAVEKVSRLGTQTISPGKEKSVSLSPNSVLVFENDGTTVEVTVKTKGKKPVTVMKDQSPLNQVDMKKRSEFCIETPNNWNKILRERNQTTVKQVMHQLNEKTPCSRFIRPCSSENRECRKSTESRKSSKYSSVSERVSKESTQKKSHDHEKPVNGIPLHLFSSESVIVKDKGIQCGGIFDKSNENFGQLNPVRTLGFLMREMEGLVNDERTSKILRQMEQTLTRIPIEQGDTTNFVAMASKAKLEATTAKLAATSKTIGELYKNTTKDNAVLQQHVQELTSRLKQSQQRQNEMECEIKQMRVELNKYIKLDSENNKIIENLKKKTKQVEALEKIISEKNSLDKKLDEEQEIIRQKELEIELLKIEKSKLSSISSYTNSQLVELRESIKNLQSSITNQLTTLKHFPNDLEFIPNPEHHSTIIQKGAACSPPTRTLSKNSVEQLSWQGISHLISTNNSNNHPERSRKRSGSRPQSPRTSDVPVNSDEEKFEEKTHLEFTSIADDQTRNSLNSAINDTACDVQFMDLQSADEVDHSKERNSPSEDETNDKSESKIRTRKRRKKSRNRSSANTLNNNNNNNNKDNNNINNQVQSPDKKTLYAPENFSTSSMYRNMKGQLQELFDNIKVKGRMPINVPEPPRNFPYPEFTDSSLPTMSISELTTHENK